MIVLAEEGNEGGMAELNQYLTAMQLDKMEENQEKMLAAQKASQPPLKPLFTSPY